MSKEKLKSKRERELEDQVNALYYLIKSRCFLDGCVPSKNKKRCIYCMREIKGPFLVGKSIVQELKSQNGQLIPVNI